MASDLYEEDPVFRRTLEDCSEVLAPVIGASLCNLIYDSTVDRSHPFDHTPYTHPAICAVQFALARSLEARGFEPDFVMGYSVGEIAAHMVSGALTMEDGLKAAADQARRLEDRTPVGGMVAILESAELFDRRPELFQGMEVAGWNFDKHFAVSGDAASVARLEAGLKESGTMHQTLPVNRAFHSIHMEPIRTDYLTALSQLNISPPSVRIVSPTEGGFLDATPPDFFWTVLRQPVHFQKTMVWLEESGPYHYVDLGPAGTLSTFVKYCLPKSSISEQHSIVTPFKG
ncbi:MAG: acyltransferase domain-containing protein, partial [Verrucomicrobiota bacterium]